MITESLAHSAHSTGSTVWNASSCGCTDAED